MLSNRVIVQPTNHISSFSQPACFPGLIFGSHLHTIHGNIFTIKKIILFTPLAGKGNNTVCLLRLLRIFRIIIRLCGRFRRLCRLGIIHRFFRLLFSITLYHLLVRQIRRTTSAVFSPGNRLIPRSIRLLFICL